MTRCKEAQADEKLSKMEFVNVQTVAFEMGDPNGDSDEPLHTVVLTKEFEILKTEVTQRQWFQVMGYNPSSFKGGEGDRNKLGNNPDHPVENVSWDEIQQFMIKLNERNDGYRYRLPTEAEWECAARGLKPEEWDRLIKEGRPAPAYSFGDDSALLTEFAWFSGNSGNQTQAAAQKKPNPFGLYDMHGNVWEWVLDPYSSDYSKAVSQEKAAEIQIAPASALYYVLRGGSSLDKPRRLRSANRERRTNDGRSNDVGFRLLRTK